MPRYKTIFDAIHDCGWHVILHSCGRINAFVPAFIELGVDVLNMQQSRSYGLVEFGEQFRGQVCFLATVDIQSTLPRGDEAGDPRGGAAAGPPLEHPGRRHDRLRLRRLGRRGSQAGSPADHVRRVRPAEPVLAGARGAAIIPLSVEDVAWAYRSLPTAGQRMEGEE